MKRTNRTVNESTIVNRVMKEIFPILESELNEISSIEWGDIADKADALYNKEVSAYAREREKAARDNEMKTEFENTLEEIETIDLGRKRFILGKYIPANIYVLIFIKDASRVAVVRVTQNSLVNIANPDIVKDIANLYGERKPIAKSNVHSMAIALEKDRKAARELADRINNALGVNISWRYFYGDADHKSAPQNPDQNYEYVKAFNITDTPYKVRIAKSISVERDEHNLKAYTIFYVLVSDGDKSSMMRVYSLKGGVNVYGYGTPGPVYRLFKEKNVVAGIPAPTPKSSNIVNIYDLFTEMKPEIAYAILSGISKTVEFKVTMKDIEHRYQAVLDANAKNRTDADDVVDAPEYGGLDANDFMDF